MKKYLIPLLLLFASCLGVAQTKFDMTTQLRQWSSQAPAHTGVIPIFDSVSGTYIPGDPFVTPNIPSIVQKTSNTSTGSVASLAKAYTSNTIQNNSLIVICGVGNGTAPTISDTLTLTWKTAVQVANGTAFNIGIFYAINGTGGADTITCNNGGTTASIGLEIYEVSGFIQPGTTYPTNILDATTSATSGSAGTSPTVTVTPTAVNEISFVGFALGTAAQTITVAAPYNNDSGQLNPTTPAGLFSMVSASFLLSVNGSSSPSATATSEPWGVVVATFKPVLYPVSQGNPAPLANAWPVKVTDGTNIQPTGDSAARTIHTTTDAGSESSPVAIATTTDSSLECSIVSAASTNATNCKNASGNMYGYEVYNTTTTVYYLRMYNTSSSPTCSSSTGFIRSIPVPPAGSSGLVGGAISNFVVPVGYSTGISFCITGGSSSTDNTNAAVGIFGAIRYK